MTTKLATKQRGLRAVQAGVADADERRQPYVDGDDLAWIPAEPAAMAREVRQLAGDLVATGGDLSAADRAALLAYFEAGARLAQLRGNDEQGQARCGHVASHGGADGQGRCAATRTVA